MASQVINVHQSYEERERLLVWHLKRQDEAQIFKKYFEAYIEKQYSDHEREALTVPHLWVVPSDPISHQFAFRRNNMQ
jgi:hypothetical protein